MWIKIPATSIRRPQTTRYLQGQLCIITLNQHVKIIKNLFFRAWLWIALSICYFVCDLAVSEITLAVNILINNSVQSELVGSANGFGIGMSAF